MLKQITSFFIIIALSVAVAFFMPEAQKLIHLLIKSHDWVSGSLTNVFNDGHAGNVSRELLALMIVPLLCGLIPAIIFFALRKRWLPYFMEIVWVVWLLEVGALAIIYVYPVHGEMGPAESSAPSIASPQTPAAAPAAPEPEPEPAPASENPAANE